MKIALIGVIAGVINGLFGSGAGMIILPALASKDDENEVKARGTTIMSVLFLSIISSIFYIKNTNNKIELIAIWYVVAGGMLGATLGSKIIRKIPAKYLQIILALFMIGTGIRMLLP